MKPGSPRSHVRCPQTLLKVYSCIPKATIYLSIYLSLSLYLYVYIENTDFPILFLRVPVITMLWYSPNPFQTLLLVDQAPTLAVRVPQLVWRSSWIHSLLEACKAMLPFSFRHGPGALLWAWLLLPLATVGALIIGIRLGGILYCNYNKEPPKPCSNY